MRTVYDGYAIAEEDLAQRGPGDFLRHGNDGSLRQIGELRFRLADAREDSEIMLAASDDARSLISADPELLAHPLLRRRVESFFSVGEEFIS